MDKVENIKNAAMAALAVTGAAITQALGGWDEVLILLIALMCADYATGVILAAVWHKSNKSETGSLSSLAGYKGLIRKGMILLVVYIATLLDKAVGANYVRTAVILFFAGNEGISLLENLGLMGLPYPPFMRKMLEVLREKGGAGKEDTHDPSVQPEERREEEADEELPRQ